MANQNRRYGIPRNGGKHMLLSRTPPLTGGMHTQYGQRQSMGVANGAWSAGRPETWPQDWPKQGKVLGVPKCVILSCLPMWTAYWPASYFYGPSDIIGQMFTSPFSFGNYYYFDQWNYAEAPIVDPTRYLDRATRHNAQFFQPGVVFDDMAGSGNEELYTDEYVAELTGIPKSDPSTFGIEDQSNPPATRFNQIILNRLENPYWTMHFQLRAAFNAAANILASDPVDPIYVIDAGWLPLHLYQIRNAYLTKTFEKFNDAHGNGANIVDVIPCYTHMEEAWGPFYPNVNDSRNTVPFDSNSVPYLACGDPGFGTNVLHLYIGHACHNFNGGSSSIWDYQSWPISPEGTFLGPVFLSNYLGASLPAFKGRRAVWRDAGLNNGFTGGVEGVYNNYGPLISAAAASYRENSQKYRNFKTKWFTFPSGLWGFNWDLNQIFHDQKHDCGATQFYFGFSFADFVNQFSNEDNWYEDLSGYYGGLKVAANYGNVPSTAGLQAAVSTFYPPIKARVEAYYNGLEPGTRDFFNMVKARNDLPDCEYVGPCDDLLSADGIVDMVRRHFAANP